MARYRCRRHNCLVSSIIEILFSYNKDIWHVSKSLETVSVSVSPTLNYWIGNSLAELWIELNSDLIQSVLNQQNVVDPIEIQIARSEHSSALFSPG